MSSISDSTQITISRELDKITIRDLQSLFTDLKDSGSMVSTETKKTMSCFEGLMVKMQEHSSTVVDENCKLRDQLTKTLGQFREFQILQQAEAKASKEKVDSLEKSLAATRNDLLESNRIANERLQKGDKDLVAALAKIQEVNQSVQKVEKQLNLQTQTNKEALSSMTLENGRNVAALQAKLSVKDTEISALRSMRTVNDHEISALQARLSVKDTEISAIQANLGVKDTEINQLKTQNLQNAKKIKNLDIYNKMAKASREGCMYIGPKYEEV